MSDLTRYVGTANNRSGVGNETLLLNPELCTVDTCDLNMANFLYIPTLPGNAALAAIFGILIVGQLGFGIKFKTWGFMVAMVFGLVLEVIGYIARILLHNNPFNGDAFLMYLVPLTIAPALMTASIYLCLGRIVNIYGENLSYFKPRTYTIVFCTFDLICLILQAAGGAIASISDTRKDINLGKNIMVAGLVFQVVALALFMVAGVEYGLRVWKGRGSRNQKHIQITRSLYFKAFIGGLALATVAIQIRCIYRVIELWEGFDSDLFVGHEPTYMILEGAMIGLACLCLTVLHPGMAFREAWADSNFKFRKAKVSSQEKFTPRGSTSDIESVRPPQAY